MCVVALLRRRAQSQRLFGCTGKELPLSDNGRSERLVDLHERSVPKRKLSIALNMRPLQRFPALRFMSSSTLDPPKLRHCQRAADEMPQGRATL